MDFRDESKPLRFWKFTASEITALCSFVVALITLIYSLGAQHFDRKYREAAIRPVIELVFEELALRATNVGVGPAIVDNTVIGYEDRCIDSGFGPPTESWSVAVDTLGRKISNDLLTPALNQLLAADDSYLEAVKKWTFFRNNSVIGAQQNWYLIYFSEFAQPQRKPPPKFIEVWDRVSGDFPPRGTRFYYRLKYSSLTGDYSSSVEISRGGMRCP